MSKLAQLPLFGIIISFLSGVLTAYQFQIPIKLGIVILCAVFLIVIGSYFLFKNYKRYDLIFGLLMILFGFFCGISTQIIHNSSLYPNHYKHFVSQDKQLIYFVIDQKIKTSEHYYRYFGSVESVDSIGCFGKILVHFPQNQFKNQPLIGQRIAAYTTIESNQTGLNPNAFDYNKYLTEQQVYAKIRIDTTNHKLIDFESNSIAFFENIRQKIIHTLQKSNFNPNELAVFQALLLGKREAIDADILRNYQYAGVVHILAVSGLHVGYLYGFILFILSFLPNHHKGKIIKFIALSSILIFYILLTGAAASTIRASLMCIILYLGFLFNRNPNNLYTVLISAWIILLFNPDFILNIGFQLSYLAVFFIIWTIPILGKIYKPKNRIIRYFWNICWLSVAAQLGVLPLTLYYFGQIPLLFICSNLLILPILGMLMPLGIVLATLAYFDIPFLYVSKILEFLIKLINIITSFIANLDAFVLRNIPFNLPLLIVSYGVIFLFFKTLENTQRNIQKLLISIIICQLTFYYSYFSRNNLEKMIVFNVPQKSLFATHQYNELTYHTYDFQDKFIQNTINNYNKYSFQKSYSIADFTNFFFINNQKILVIDADLAFNLKEQPDIIILRNSPKVNIERLFTNNQPKIIIADGSNYYSFVNLWHKSCKNHQIAFHHTAKDGFYQID